MSRRSKRTRRNGAIRSPPPQSDYPVYWEDAYLVVQDPFFTTHVCDCTQAYLKAKVAIESRSVGHEGWVGHVPHRLSGVCDPHDDHCSSSYHIWAICPCIPVRAHSGSVVLPSEHRRAYPHTASGIMLHCCLGYYLMPRSSNLQLKKSGQAEMKSFKGCML